MAVRGRQRRGRHRRQADGCPMDPEDRDNFEDVDGCPDPDNDKTASRQDRRLSERPEDKDSFEDDDGCPDPDNDKDGIVDTADKCPNEPGVPPTAVEEVRQRRRHRDQDRDQADGLLRHQQGDDQEVSFDLLTRSRRRSRTTRRSRSRSAATRTARQRQLQPEAVAERANSVRTYLIKQGITSDRMTAKGYGENVMIADNRTADGGLRTAASSSVITAK